MLGVRLQEVAGAKGQIHGGETGGYTVYFVDGPRPTVGENLEEGVISEWQGQEGRRIWVQSFRDRVSQCYVYAYRRPLARRAVMVLLRRAAGRGFFDSPGIADPASYRMGPTLRIANDLEDFSGVIFAGQLRARAESCRDLLEDVLGSAGARENDGKRERRSAGGWIPVETTTRG